MVTRPKSLGTSTKQQNPCGAQTCCYNNKYNTRKYQEHKTLVSVLFMQVQQPLFVCLVVERRLMIRVPPQWCHASYLCYHIEHQRSVFHSLQLWSVVGARCSCIICFFKATNQELRWCIVWYITQGIGKTHYNSEELREFVLRVAAWIPGGTDKYCI